MKYAIISDIHGNMPAFSAVLEDAKLAGVDKYIFVGDYYMSLPYPNKVINELRDYKNHYIVRGNEEEYLQHLASQDKKTWTDGQMCTLYWCFRTVTKDNRIFYQTFQNK